MAKVSFLNGDHKNGETLTDSPFLWSPVRKGTLVTVVTEKFWRHKNAQWNGSIDRGIKYTFSKIDPIRTINENMSSPIVAPYCQNSWYRSGQNKQSVHGSTSRQWINLVTSPTTFMTIRSSQMLALSRGPMSDGGVLQLRLSWRSAQIYLEHLSWQGIISLVQTSLFLYMARMYEGHGTLR